MTKRNGGTKGTALRQQAEARLRPHETPPPR